MSPPEKAERQKVLQSMAMLVRAFYAKAVFTNVHTFIEFAGFMQEYIKMLQKMLDDGIDFMDNELRAQPHNMAYIAEKFDCIFGHAGYDPKNAGAFYRALEAKGWPTMEDVSDQLKDEEGGEHATRESA